MRVKISKLSGSQAAAKRTCWPGLSPYHQQESPSGPLKHVMEEGRVGWKDGKLRWLRWSWLSNKIKRACLQTICNSGISVLDHNPFFLSSLYGARYNIFWTWAISCNLQNEQAAFYPSWKPVLTHHSQLVTQIRVQRLNHSSSCTPAKGIANLTHKKLSENLKKVWSWMVTW